MSALGLEVMNVPPRRKAEEIVVSFPEPIQDAELPRLRESKGYAPHRIASIRDQHHALARALADGLNQNEAAIVAGFTPSNVSLLMGDPTFRELVSFYRSKVADAYDHTHAQMARLASRGLELLAERLDDNPDEVTTKDLLEVVKTVADRTGYGPQTKNMNLNVNVGLADRMALAMRRAKGEV